MRRLRVALFGIALLGCLGPAGCAGLSGTRPAPSRVTWRPFLIAHIADPMGGKPGALQRLRDAAARLVGERYLEAVIVSGDMGGPQIAVTAVARVLRGSRRPLFLAGSAVGVVESDAPVRGLRLLAMSAGSSDPSPNAVRALEDPVRDALAGIRGEFAVLALDWSPLKPGGDAEGGAAAAFSYMLEGSEKLRVVVSPGVEGRVERQGGLVYIDTPPLEGGQIRLIAVNGHRLTTWLRPIAEGGEDGPKTAVKTR